MRRSGPALAFAMLLGSAFAPVAAQGLPSDVEQQLGLRPNSPIPSDLEQRGVRPGAPLPSDVEQQLRRQRERQLRSRYHDDDDYDDERDRRSRWRYRYGYR
jgi:hypothetical protein